MTKIIHKKESLITTHQAVAIPRFSARTVSLLTNQLQLQTDQALKQEITIVYDSNGHVESPASLNLGIQFDNRVTWLKFNFDKMLWNDDTIPDDEYTKANRYDKYTFRIYFKQNKEDTLIYEIDPRIPFEVPRTITRHQGTFQMAVSIQEITTDTWPGNTTEPEVFITNSIDCMVAPTWYDEQWDLVISPWESDQLRTLTKVPLTGELSDLGEFKLDSTDLGRARDNYVKYLRFDFNRITAHISNLTTIALFYCPTTKEHYGSLFQHIDPDDPYDDHTENHPYIAWIPSEVYTKPENWEIMLVSFAGDVSTQLEDDNYYFYVSTTVKGQVHDSLITAQDLLKEPINVPIISNFTLNDGSTMYTHDNEIFNTMEVKA